MNDLGLDSLDHVEIIMAVEDEFGEKDFLSVLFIICHILKRSMIAKSLEALNECVLIWNVL